MAWRFLAQRTISQEWLDMDVPLVLDSAPRRELNGPGQLTGTVNPEYARLLAAPDGLRVLEEWATTIYAEYNGQIRWGGIVTHTSWEGQAFHVEAAGYSTYPAGMPYLGGEIHSGVSSTAPSKYKDKNHDGYIDGTHPRRKVPKAKTTISTRWDAYDVVRAVWSHLQGQPNGNLHLAVDGHKSGILMGAADGSSPYELLWWEAPDCNDTINNVMSTAQADYLEAHSWNAARTDVNHRLILGNRRIGRGRPDLRFCQGENIIAMASPTGMSTDYASEAFVIGKGSGRKTVTQKVYRPSGPRLRRSRVLSEKWTGNTALLRNRAEQVLNTHNQQYTVPQIAVRDHPNARLGSWAPGDHILVQIDVPWLGQMAVWHRIMAEEIDPAAGTAVLTLARNDHYGDG
jgi:hypothetical protein